MESLDYLIIIIIASFGIFPGHILHESSHWFIGKVAGSKPKPIWAEISGRKIYWPRGIRHEELDRISNRAIQISGSVPIIWPIIAMLPLILFLCISEPFCASISPTRILIILAPFWASVEMSESDVTALLEPEKYRNRSKQDNLSRKWGWPIFLRKSLYKIKQFLRG